MQHLDEGMIHAWLDGQLPQDEAARVEAHVAECRQCADAVAEARGLIAASSRILLALDSVPRDVAPKPNTVLESALPEGVLSLRREAPPNVESFPAKAPVTAPPARPTRRWFTGPTMAAAAAAVVAVGMFSLYQRDRLDAPADAVARIATSALDSSPVAIPSAASAPVPSPLGAAGAANEARPQSPPAPPAERARREADSPVVAPQRFAMADSSARDERRNLAEPQVAADLKIKELTRAVPAATRPDTATVTVLRGNAVSQARVAEQELAKASADRADAAAVGGIRGRVTDANNTGVAGAMVQVAGTNTAMTTNAQGEYSLGGVQPGGQQLVVKRLGYQEAKRDVSVVQGQTASADIVITPTTMALSEVVVTGAGATSARERVAARSATPPPAAAPANASGVVAEKRQVGQQPQAGATGCYEWTVTPTNPQQRTRFLQVPRRLALDSAVTPSSNDGIWYLARDIARTGTVLPNGLWRPIDGGFEVQWVVASKTSTVRLTGGVSAVMRGTIEEIDRAAGTGEAGSVISMRRPCEG